MINKLELYLKKYNLADENKILVVGFSGGYDSCALLHGLAMLRNEHNFKLCAAHLNHGWRGMASELDEKNCKEFCQKHNVPFYSEKLDENTPKTETAARKARYEFFENSAKKFNTDIIFTAHTKSDNAETLIYRIAKGTGISGLCGIEEFRHHNNLKIYRPLLDTSRTEIEKYCIENNITPNNDLSNFDTKYKRNFIRHEILPALKNINQNTDTALSNLAQNALESEIIICEYIEKIRAQISDKNKFYTSKFTKLSSQVQQRIIYDLVTENKLEYDRKKILEILEFITFASKLKSGKTHSLTNNLWLFCSEKEFYIITKEDTNSIEKVEISDFSKTHKIGKHVFQIKPFTEQTKIEFPAENANMALVDLSNQRNLYLRYWQNGDRIQPFGMEKTTKLKKYFTNKATPKHKRHQTVLLCNDSEVLWACGVGISEKLRAQDKPTHILMINEVQNDN